MCSHFYAWKLVRPTGTTAFAYMYTGLWQSTAFYKIVILYGHPLQRLIVIKKKLIICYSKLYPPLKISLSHSGHMFFLWYEKELNYSHALFLSDVWDKVLKRNTYLLYKVKIPICLDRGISAFSLIRGKTPAYKWYSPATGNFCYIKWKITICLDIGNICIFSDKRENSCIQMV